MAKAKKLTTGMKSMITRRFKAGKSIPEISAELEISCTLVRRYVLRWCKAECDRYWSLIVRRKGKCELSGKIGVSLIAHHILEKGAFLWLRWDLDNGICIAINYHDTRYGNIREMSTHGTLHQLDMFRERLKEVKPEQFRYYLDNRDSKAYREIDILETYERLKSEANKWDLQ